MNEHNNRVSIKELSKNYNDLKALDKISFDIPSKSIFALLGPNGSGKSTLIKVLSKLIKEWDGDIFYNGESIKSNNNYIKNFGFIIEDPCFYEYLSAKKNLQIFSRLTNTPSERINAVLELVDLVNRANDKVSNFSYGMKQRLGIAQALLHDPEILVLDEPNNGLDPIGVNKMADLIYRLNQEGKTICISTHSLSEVDRLCSDVAILKEGKLLITKNIKKLSKNNKFYRLEVFDITSASNYIKTFSDVKIIAQENNILIISIDSSEPTNMLPMKLNDHASVKSVHRESNLIQYFYD
jgi:ABC-type multidrug transport system ATPase subunit|tara:strand:- start:947 stop:1834 length:888 start_codon:yes stop_codon:yes gene_type:complete